MVRRVNRKRECDPAVGCVIGAPEIATKNPWGKICGRIPILRLSDMDTLEGNFDERKNHRPVTIRDCSL